MSIFDRPLALCCFSFVLFAWVGYAFSGILKYIFVGVLLLCVLLFVSFLICRTRRMHSVARALLICFFCMLFSASSLVVSYSYFVKKQNCIDEFYNKDVAVEGKCIDVLSERSFSCAYEVEVFRVDGKDVSFRMRLETEGQRLVRGQHFSVLAAIRSFESSSDGFDCRMYYLSEGMLARIEVGQSEIEKGAIDAVSVFAIPSMINDSVTDRLSYYLSDEGAAFFSAVFCADRSDIGDFDMLSITRTGTSHLLSVSGMHFVTVVGMALVALSALGVPLPFRYATLMLIALSYAAFTGFSPSVIRSAIMLFITYFGSVIGKSRDSVTSLAFAMLLMLIVCPNYILSASFWLSCSATLGIIVVSPVMSELIRRKHRAMYTDVLRDDSYTVPLRILMFACAAARGAVSIIPYALLSSVVVSIAAVMFSLPFSILFFGSVSYATIPCGVLLSPVVTLTLTLAPFVIVMCPVSFIADAASFLAELFFTITRFFSGIKGVYVNVSYISVYALMLLFVVAIAVSVHLSRSKKPLLCICALTLCLVFVCASIEKQFAFVHSHTVYSAQDSISVRTDDGLMIVDMGSSSLSDIDRVIEGASVLKENEIRAFVFTYFTSNQEMLVRHLVTNCSVSTLYFPDYVTEKMKILSRASQSTAERYGAEVSYYRYGESCLIGDVRIEVGEIEYLDRSDLPIYTASVEYNGDCVLWLSSSCFEGKKNRHIYSREYDYCIVGGYGPKEMGVGIERIFNISAARYVISKDSQDCLTCLKGIHKRFGLVDFLDDGDVYRLDFSLEN